jgi:adenine/guanine phosphoribosyltransferase-like PRPP-binding protein
VDGLERVWQPFNDIAGLQARDPQHRGSGYRYPELFQDQMTLLRKPKHPVVLFDDVMTSGSQMTAAARLLQDAGHLPIQAMVVGRVTRTQEDKMLGWESEALQIGREIIDGSGIEF